MSEVTKYENTKPLKLYWIYDEDYFLGGNPCPVGKEYFAQQHMDWLASKVHGNLRIEWEPGTFTYQESYIRAREKAEEVQRDQPGPRLNWECPELFMEIANIASMPEIVRVRMARIHDAQERDALGTDDQKELDEARRKSDPRLDPGRPGEDDDQADL